MALAGDDDVLSILRKQAGQSAISSREMTGVGFFTNFIVPLEAPRIPGRPRIVLHDVIGTAANVKHGMVFVLFIGDGALRTLEGATYDEPRPDEVQGLVLSYWKDRNGKRNMEELRKHLLKVQQYGRPSTIRGTHKNGISLSNEESRGGRAFLQNRPLLLTWSRNQIQLPRRVST